MFEITELMFSNSKIQIRNLATFEQRNRIFLYTLRLICIFFNSRHCGGIGNLSVFIVIIIEL